MSKTQPKEVKIDKTPEEILEKAPAAVTKAFSMDRVEGGWRFLTYIFHDDELVETERTEPELKSITIEKFKIAAFKYWSSIG